MAQEIPDTHLVAEIGQKALIRRDGMVLIVQYPHNDSWDLPGGRIHKGEEVAEGLAREVREEVGLDVEVGESVAVWVQHEPKPTWPRYFVLLTATLKDPTQSIVCAPDEIKDARWVTPEEAVEKLSAWSRMGPVVARVLTSEL